MYSARLVLEFVIHALYMFFSIRTNNSTLGLASGSRLSLADMIPHTAYYTGKSCKTVSRNATTPAYAQDLSHIQFIPPSAT